MTTAAKTTATKKRVSKTTAKKKAARKATAKPRTPAKKTAKKTRPQQKVAKHVDGNPYRDGSFYATCFDCLAKMGTKKPVSRQKLLTAYCKASGKEVKKAKYDLAVILSPTKEGTGHRSSRKMAYYVERLENSMVKLHMAPKAE